MFSKWPSLGTSPDALVDGYAVQVVEMKCPSTKPNLPIITACDDNEFCLELCNGVPKLKFQHPRFNQCQDIMSITEIHRLDIVVYSLKDMHIETIWFEQGKWNNKILPKLKKIFLR